MAGLQLRAAACPSSFLYADGDQDALTAACKLARSAKSGCCARVFGLAPGEVGAVRTPPVAETQALRTLVQLGAPLAQAVRACVEQDFDGVLLALLEAAQACGRLEECAQGLFAAEQLDGLVCGPLHAEPAMLTRFLALLHKSGWAFAPRMGELEQRVQDHPHAEALLARLRKVAAFEQRLAQERLALLVRAGLPDLAADEAVQLAFCAP